MNKEFFEERNRLVMGGLNKAMHYEMRELAKLAGIEDDAVAHAPVECIIGFAKANMLEKLNKHTENLIYFVERAV